VSLPPQMQRVPPLPSPRDILLSPFPQKCPFSLPSPRNAKGCSFYVFAPLASNGFCSSLFLAPSTLPSPGCVCVCSFSLPSNGSLHPHLLPYLPQGVCVCSFSLPLQWVIPGTFYLTFPRVCMFAPSPSPPMGVASSPSVPRLYYLPGIILLSWFTVASNLFLGYLYFNQEGSYREVWQICLCSRYLAGILSIV
jgi:hypothetical protein